MPKIIINITNAAYSDFLAGYNSQNMTPEEKILDNNMLCNTEEKQAEASAEDAGPFPV